MAKWKQAAADAVAVSFGIVARPALRFLSRNTYRLPRWQRYADNAGFQIRSTHYYEPTYSEAHLPAVTEVERYLPAIDMNEAGQLALLRQFTFADELRDVPLERTSETEFFHENIMYAFGEADLYYSMIRLKKPRRIIEVGSGNSTLMAKKAVEANRREDPSYSCEQICIEPYEMPWLDAIGVKVIRERVETVDLAVFDQLEADDILFIDSSHVIRPWGDVLREFNEIIPSVKPGVLVHVHDIFTPFDYPEAWLRRERKLWNEQYLLEAFLAFNNAFEVICAVHWLSHHHWEEFSRAAPSAKYRPGRQGGAFWMVRRS